MTFRTLELPTVTIDAIEQVEDCLTIKFHGEIIKTMDAAKQRTCWRQSGTLAKSNPNQHYNSRQH